MSEKSDEEISRTAFDNCLRQQATPTPEGEGDAREAAKRIVASVAEADAMLVARALLSSPRVEEVRREALEEAAKVAETDNTPAYGSDNQAMEWLAHRQRQNIAERIRSLSLQVG